MADMIPEGTAAAKITPFGKGVVIHVREVLRVRRHQKRTLSSSLLGWILVDPEKILLVGLSSPVAP